ncbi:hypothetical protein M407DRAFT_139436 [Tulasnella calospora MUT 4182]|uniref:Uncharacterized protein n=1 Tax=Tulasnella calospora MUT 4182 TaxID=1051891 RepID=A0A0C3MBW7_9AGAM|nr:hypothetical protein M407DRAFT_139436 [Tulasnella calospora MUT 4182]
MPLPVFFTQGIHERRCSKHGGGIPGTISGSQRPSISAYPMCLERRYGNSPFEIAALARCPRGVPGHGCSF